MSFELANGSQSRMGSYPSGSAVPSEPDSDVGTGFDSRLVASRGVPGCFVADFNTFNSGVPDRAPDSQHPVFRPNRTKCAFCGEFGHTLLYCRERLELNEGLSRKFCVKGWHLPHLHDDADVWRCQWCSLHLGDNYVWDNYPTVAKEEYAKFKARRKMVQKYFQ